MIAPQATPEELVIQEVEVPLVPKTFPLFPVWLGKVLVSARDVIQDGLAYEPVVRAISAVVIPLTAVPDKFPPVIVAPLIVTKPLSCPPVINTLLADWVAIVPNPETSEVEIPNKVLTWDPVNAIGVAAEPVLFPIMELAAKFAILPKVTAPEAIAVAKLPSVFVTSPDNAGKDVAPSTLVIFDAVPVVF